MLKQSRLELVSGGVKRTNRLCERSTKTLWIDRYDLSFYGDRIP